MFVFIRPLKKSIFINLCLKKPLINSIHTSEVLESYYKSIFILMFDKYGTLRANYYMST